MISDKPIQDGFIKLVMRKRMTGRYEAFHFTSCYNWRSPCLDLARGAQVATMMLKRLVPRLLSGLISPNWQRPSFRSGLHIFSFLDLPGSRRAPGRTYETALSLGEPHHHSIILLKPRLVNCMRRRILRLLNMGQADASNRALVIDRRLARDLRSGYLQHIDSEADLQDCTSYATKMVDILKLKFPDDAYHFF
jgi:hypothetical protein